MKLHRRQFLAGAAGLAALSPSLGQAQTRWQMATPYADGNLHTRNIRTFIQEIEQATGGRLSIQLHSNGSLLPMPQIKRGVQQGQVQLGEILLTAYANDPKAAEEIIKAVKGPPVVIKLIEGTQGIGVVLAETMSSAKSVIEAFRGANVNILVQEFIKEAGGTDIRALVVGGKVVAAMKRTGAPDEFRSNLHRGGSAQVIKITPEERSTAVRAAKRMGLNVCGVDMLRSNHGPVIMEVNSSPGLEGIESATGKDIAGQIIDFIAANAKDGQTKTKGRG